MATVWIGPITNRPIKICPGANSVVSELLVNGSGGSSGSEGEAISAYVTYGRDRENHGVIVRIDVGSGANGKQKQGQSVFPAWEMRERVRKLIYLPQQLTSNENSNRACGHRQLSHLRIARALNGEIVSENH